MSKGPGLFSDIGKKAKGKIYSILSLCYDLASHASIAASLFVDLLTKDYSSDQKFSVYTYTDAGVVRLSKTILLYRFTV